MKSCEKYQKNLVLYAYQDLDDVQRAEMEAHLLVCGECRGALEEIRQLQIAVPMRPLIDPDAAMLRVLRHAVSQKVRAHARDPQPRRSFFFSFLEPAPVFQLGFALLLLALGFMLGRETKTVSSPPSAQMLQHLLTANMDIQSPNSAIQPFLAGVEKLQYDPATGKVEIYYNTVNDVYLRGDMRDPAVRQMLRHAMLEETNPAVRLHAVKAVNAMAESNQEVDSDLLDAIRYLLEKDQNEGVRLQALRVLKALPFDNTVKNMLVKILLYDTNAALRIEAFEVLTGVKATTGDLQSYMRAAKQDSNSFVRFQAGKIVDEIQKSNRSGLAPSKPIEIRREENP